MEMPLWALREHAAFGLGSKAGEIMKLHQLIHEGQALDEAKLRAEMGGCLQYLAEMCDVYGWELQDIAISSIQQIRKLPKHNELKHEPIRSKYYSMIKAKEMKKHD